jgi:phospholipid/cholesterol/gamma-HCH transport system ATP-binding protein
MGEARPDVGEPLVEAVDVRKSFESGDVLRGISFTVSRGETLVIMGGSGSGKTVTLRCVAGLLRPDAGRMRLFGREIQGLSEEEMLPLRRRLGYVFQGAALFDSVSVFDNVAFPLREHFDLDARETAERVHRYLALVGLGDEVQPLLPAALSGGMRKRVGIARALANDPELLLFDEPTAGLDPTNANLVGELIARMGTGVCDTSIVVTHDLELTRMVADRVAILIEGRFAALGDRDTVLASSQPEVQAFLEGKAR